MHMNLFAQKLILAPLALVAALWFSACSSPSPLAPPGAGGAGNHPGGGGNGGVGFNTAGSTAASVGGGLSNCAAVDGGRCYTVDAGPYCGDGKIDPGELCDDNNRIGGDGCSGVCQIEPHWTCPTAGQPCVSDIVCGNSVRQTGEGCDDGNKTSGDGCDSSCNTEAGWYCAGITSGDPTSKSECKRLASCGDARVTQGETCDLGTAVNGTGVGCDATCGTQDGWICRPLPTGCKHISVCGNGKVEGGEECDDGNKTGGDGCSDTCKIEASYYDCSTPGVLCTNTARCGDSVLENNETCDDGGTTPGDGCSATCQVEAGWQCRMPGKACVPLCGDNKITATEQCDDGNDTSGDGCSSTCLIEPGWSCTTPAPSTCTKSVCGNGIVETGESCDKGAANGLFYGDGTGCSKTCTNEPKCRDTNGVTGPCTQICGDGNKDANEQCDDGNQVSGDGCSATCQTETGFVCTPTILSDAQPCPSAPGLQCLVLPVTYRDFDGQQASGGHPDFFYYGATPTGTPKPGVVPGATVTTCVPNASGTKAAYAAGQACPSTDQTGLCLGLVQGTLGSDGKPLLTGSSGQCPCVFTDWDKTGLLGTCPATGTAVCTPSASMPSVGDCWVTGPGDHRLRVDTTVTVIQSATSFKQWYSDSTFSTKVLGTLELAATGTGTYQFSSSTPGAPAGAVGRTVTDDIHAIFMGTQTTLTSGFFPLEAQPKQKVCNIWPYWLPSLATAAGCTAATGTAVPGQWDPLASGTRGVVGTGAPVQPVLGLLRNFYFTTEIRYLFRYDGTASTLAFYGDDDVWVFVNGKLALDLGAPHERLQGSVSIGAGLTAGNTYEIAIFHADVHPRESNYQLTLSGFNTTRSVCQPRCGDGITTAGEECDNGAANSDTLYDGCTTQCKFGPFCGDSIKNGPEDCDDGKNTTVTSSSTTTGACGPGCKFPPSCGDGKIQPGEECDDGASNTTAQCGGCGKTCQKNPYCGDTVTDTACGEQCDDGVNIGGYSYCDVGCVWGPRCGDSVVQKDFGETCDLGAQNSDAAGSTCNTKCGVPAVCGDGIVQAPETCDNGVNDGSYGGCRPDCTPAANCGDGYKNGPEECDYGSGPGGNSPLNNAVYGGCLVNCKLGPRCGDKIVQPPEQCDEGPTGSDQCSAQCIVQIVHT